jgi:hypothetical protein
MIAEFDSIPAARAAAILGPFEYRCLICNKIHTYDIADLSRNPHVCMDVLNSIILNCLRRRQRIKKQRKVEFDKQFQFLPECYWLAVHQPYMYFVHAGASRIGKSSLKELSVDVGDIIFFDWQEPDRSGLLSRRVFSGQGHVTLMTE